VNALDAAGNRSRKASLRTRTKDCTSAPAPDTTAPSTPSGLAQTAASLGTITIAWNASTDNVGVTGYGVYSNGASAGTATSPGYIVSGLNCGTQYSLAVDAYDAAGNHSAKATLTGTTSACPAPTPAPTPSGGDLYLSPAGSDANPCSATAPCRNFQRAYDLAQPGATVVLAGGSYGSQRVSGTKSAPAVVFKPAAGASVSLGGLDVYADNLEIRDLAAGYWLSYAESSGFTARNLDVSFFQIYGSANITVAGGDVGPSYTPGGNSTVNYITYGANGTVAPTNVVVDGVYFHDFRRGSSLDHMECLMVVGGNGIAVRNSRFVRCDIFNIFFTQWAGPAPPKNVVLEDNFFNSTTTDGNLGGTSLSVQFSGHMNLMSGYTIRNNSFAMPVGIDAPVSGVSFIGNVMPYSGCVGGVSYTYNVMQDNLGGRCGSTDKVVSGTRYENDKLGFVNPTGGDLHLTATSPAINAGSPTNFALADIDGQARPMGAAPDAGADEKS
jgi:hypothetical protein